MHGLSVMLSVPPEGQENIPELCEPPERIAARLSAQAELQNHEGVTLWFKSPSLTTPGRPHAEDKRSGRERQTHAMQCCLPSNVSGRTSWGTESQSELACVKNGIYSLC